MSGFFSPGHGRRWLLALALGALAACSEPLPDTSLFADLAQRPDDQARSALLKSRLEARFPIGGREAGLAEYLRAQGMTVRRTHVDAGRHQIYGEARHERRVGVCGVTAQVWWYAKADGTLLEINTAYGSDSCL